MSQEVLRLFLKKQSQDDTVASTAIANCLLPNSFYFQQLLLLLLQCDLTCACLLHKVMLSTVRSVFDIILKTNCKPMQCQAKHK